MNKKLSSNPFAELGAREKSEDTKSEQKATQVFFGLLGGVFLFFAIWGSVGTLDVASMATGDVIPSSQVKSIQHLEGGIVREILVREGQVVKKGQLLVRLERVISGADVAELKIRIQSLRIDIARLEAEASGKEEPIFDDELIANAIDMVSQALDQFRARKDDLANKVRVQEVAILQRKYDIREIESRLENLKEALKLHDEKVLISEQLMKDDLSNRYQHLDLLTRANELRGSIKESRAALNSAKAALNEATFTLSQINSSYLSDVLKSLEEARSTYRELKERLIKYQDNLSRTEVRSSVDGIIKTLHVVTEGGVIKAGDPVVDIVPEDDKLIVEAQLPTGDIGYVKMGQDVDIKLASSDAARFKAIKGVVASISPDTILTADGLPYYKIRVETDKSYFERGDIRYQLYPGMQVVANVKIGTRSVFEYILGPVFSSMDDALQER